MVVLATPRRLLQGVRSALVGCSMCASPPRASMHTLSAPLAATPPAPGRVKLALCQILVHPSDKAANLAAARAAVAEAAGAGAKLICLPECFNSPYDSKLFPQYAEEVPSSFASISSEIHPSTHMLCTAAREHGVFLIGGSIPERDGDAVYNTCVVVGDDGHILCRHRKMHLFDIGAQTNGEKSNLYYSP